MRTDWLSLFLNTDAFQETRDLFEQSKQQDKKRWKHADFDQDGSLSLHELAAFDNPENYETMKEYNVEATFQGMDVDNNGKLSLMEYLGKFLHLPFCYVFK